MVAAGKKFGRWTVVSAAPPKPRPNGKYRLMWLCVCECGKSANVQQDNLIRGGSVSCGCARVETILERCMTHGCAEYGNPTPEYRAWQAMWNRCTNPHYEHYNHYGGRGVCVCESWKQFENFLADMGPRPADKQTLDRINTNGNYEPGNCRWATWFEQARNKRKKHGINLSQH